MPTPVHKAGTDDPCVTNISYGSADKESVVITVEGPYDAVSAITREDAETIASDELPQGSAFTVESLRVESTGDGFGKATISLFAIDSEDVAGGFSPVRTTFRVDMTEVQYDLEDHPKLANVRDKVLAWLATDESERVKSDKFYYHDAESDEALEITEEPAKKFCQAYMAGIKTFNRYFPVIEKISIWKNPPGLTTAGTSFTGGELPFSANVGTFDEPPISINGFEDDGFFKSGDGWVQNENKTWTRTEQWTYSPEGSKGGHAWIYDNKAIDE